MDQRGTSARDPGQCRASVDLSVSISAHGARFGPSMCTPGAPHRGLSELRIMNRRNVLQWLSRSLGAITAGVIGIPGVQYVRDTLQQGQEPGSAYRRVARLRDLQPGRPLQVPVMGQVRDAWTVEANQVVGRVWLVRAAPAQEADSGSSQSSVAAFTTVCPHMGCQVQLQAGTGFVCPCHRAAFGLDGARIDNARTREPNHAPRGLDSLDCRVVRDAELGDDWVEVRYQKFEAGSTQKVST